MSAKPARYKRRFLFHLTIVIAATVCACVLAYGVGLYFKTRDFLRRQALAEDRRQMELVNYNAERIIDSVQKTAIGLFYGLDAQTVMHASADQDPMFLLSNTEVINDIATANPNVLSVEIYNSRLARVFAGPNAPPSDDKYLLGLFEGGSPLPRLRLIPRAIRPVYGDPEKTDLELSLFMFEAPPNGPPGSDGALVMNIDSKWLFESIDLVNRSEHGGTLLVVGADGSVLHGGKSPKDVQLGPHLRALLDDPGSTIHQRVTVRDGRELVVTGVTPRGAAFSLFEIRTTANAYSQYFGFFYSLAFVSLLFFLFSVGVTILVSRRLYRPLNLLLRDVHFPLAIESSSHDFDEFSYLNEMFRRNLSQLRSLKNREESNLSIVKTFLIRSLLLDSEHFDRDAFGQIPNKELRIDMEGPLLIVLLRIWETDGDLFGRTKDSSAAVIELSGRAGLRFEHVSIGRDEVALLISGTTDSSSVRAEVVEDLGTAIETWNRLLGVDVAVAVSDWVVDASELSLELTRCRNNVHYSYILGLNVVIGYDDVERHDAQSYILETLPLEAELKSSVVHGDEARFANLMELVAGRIAGQRLENVMSSVSELVGAYISAVRIRRELSEKSANPLSLNELRRRLERCPTLEDLKSSLSSLIASELRANDNSDPSRQTILVEAAKEYVAKNFSDPGLYVPKIAEAFKVNATYLGRVFRSVAGIGLIDYIHISRIEKAKELLICTDLSVRAVMENVGFDNKSNFYRIFRQVCGVAPREFVVMHSLRSMLGDQ